MSPSDENLAPIDWCLADWMTSFPSVQRSIVNKQINKQQTVINMPLPSSNVRTMWYYIWIIILYRMFWPAGERSQTKYMLRLRRWRGFVSICENCRLLLYEKLPCGPKTATLDASNNLIKFCSLLVIIAGGHISERCWLKAVLSFPASLKVIFIFSNTI